MILTGSVFISGLMQVIICVVLCCAAVVLGGMILVAFVEYCKHRQVIERQRQETSLALAPKCQNRGMSSVYISDEVKIETVTEYLGDTDSATEIPTDSRGNAAGAATAQRRQRNKKPKKTANRQAAETI